MVPCETRFLLLVRLAWELRAVSATAVLVVPYYAEPVLYVGDGAREPVLAVQHGGHWLLVWRGCELATERLAAVARRIAMEAAA
jgi:hypothetical protein